MIKQALSRRELKKMLKSQPKILADEVGKKQAKVLKNWKNLFDPGKA